MKLRLSAKASAIAIAAGMICGGAHAQSATEALTEEVLVTAQKKANAEDVQDVPLAVTAFGDAQLDALKVRDISNLSYSVPNVQFEDVGTTKGVANFSIRGLGVNSSIPSIDPAVGTFVDGVYLGTNSGVLFDIFDLESIEVLRGPQGILFGRNVTGGAVLINSKKPNLEKFEAQFKGSVDTGFRGTGQNYTAFGAVSGPIIKDVLGFRVTGYFNDDNGWHKRYLGGPNLVNRVLAVGGTNALLQLGSPLVGGVARPIAVNRPDAFENFGVSETWSVKPQLLWRPSDAVELRLQYQRFQSQGDGPAGQNHFGFRVPYDTAAGEPVPPARNTNVYFDAPKNSFTFSIDEPGRYELTVDSVTAELNIDVGNGSITNVFGWRSQNNFSLGDIDATPLWLFHSTAETGFDQISNEIRYAGRFFDRLDATVGFYYFSSDLDYQEERFLLGGFRNAYGGGSVDSRNYAVFGQLDFDITDTISLIGGARYTNERKEASIANVIPRAARCDAVSGACGFDLVDDFTWTYVTPKVALQWQPRDDFQGYVSWTQGVRSGGYNVRHTAPAIPNARFDEETVDTFELGFKAQPADGRALINFAIFFSNADNIQREINLTDAAVGVVQLIRNTADARIFGMELEARYSITDNLIVTGNLGRLDGDYRNVLFNLNSDFRDIVTGTPTTTGIQNLPTDTDIIDARDLALQIPRLAPWTWGMGFIHSMELGSIGTLNTRFNYSHRDDNAYTDNNLGILQGADLLDFSTGLSLSERAEVSLYGQNLLNEVTHGGETQLPASVGGGSFAPLNKGRVLGVELQLRF